MNKTGGFGPEGGAAEGESADRGAFYRLNMPDIVLILLILGGASALLLFTKLGLNWNLSQRPMACIYHNGKLIHEADLEKNDVFSLDQGHMKIEVKDGAIRILESDCPNKICVHTGFIREAGQIIACIPNQIMIEIKTKKEPSLDAIVP